MPEPLGPRNHAELLRRDLARQSCSWLGKFRIGRSTSEFMRLKIESHVDPPVLLRSVPTLGMPAVILKSPFVFADLVGVDFAHRNRFAAPYTGIRFARPRLSFGYQVVGHKKVRRARKTTSGGGSARTDAPEGCRMPRQLRATCICAPAAPGLNWRFADIVVPPLL